MRLNVGICEDAVVQSFVGSPGKGREVLLGPTSFPEKLAGSKRAKSFGSKEAWGTCGLDGRHRRYRERHWPSFLNLRRNSGNTGDAKYLAKAGIGV